MMETTAEYNDGSQNAAADIDQGEFAREKLKACVRKTLSGVK